MSRITFDISRLVPRFLYKDKNGYAISKAIECAFRYAAAKVEEGIAVIQNPDEMPEWRLDELAEEYNILYDYTADIEVKRNWIKNTTGFYSIYGTPAGIVQYLQGVFDTVTLEEFWEYGGDPFHFRVIVTGEWSDEVDEWAKKSIAQAKNVRSVLDAIIFNSGGVEIPLYVAAAVTGIDITDEVQML